MAEESGLPPIPPHYFHERGNGKFIYSAQMAASPNIVQQSHPRDSDQMSEDSMSPTREHSIYSLSSISPRDMRNLDMNMNVNNIWLKLRDCASGLSNLTPDDAEEVLQLLYRLANCDTKKSHEEITESIIQKFEEGNHLSVMEMDENFLRYLTSHYTKLAISDAQESDDGEEVQEPITPKECSTESLSQTNSDKLLQEYVQMSDELLAALDNFHRWDFDVFALCSHTPYPLIVVTERALDELHLTWKLELNTVKLRRFLADIQDAYLKLPYHNLIHAADVTQTMFHMLTECRLMDSLGLSELSVFSILIAAGMHDVSHPGLTSKYLIGISDPLAVQYNDISPLENMHLATAFTLWMKKKNNFTERMNKAMFKDLRKIIIEMVLATDNDGHFALMEKVEGLLSGPDFALAFPQNVRKGSITDTVTGTEPTAMQTAELSRAQSESFPNNTSNARAFLQRQSSVRTITTKSSKEDRGNFFRVASAKSTPGRPASMTFSPQTLSKSLQSSVSSTSYTPVEPRKVLLLQLALHAADVSNPAKPWEIHMRWLPRIMEEFYCQGDKEREMGIPITFAFDRTTPIPSPKFQMGFLKVILAPLYKTFSRIPGMKIAHCLESLDGNIRNFEAMASGEAPDTASVIANTPVTPLPVKGKKSA